MGVRRAEQFQRATDASHRRRLQVVKVGDGSNRAAILPLEDGVSKRASILLDTFSEVARCSGFTDYKRADATNALNTILSDRRTAR